MNELGKKLRDARIEKGYTLNTLQQHTKIQKKYLQAIEEGNLDEMPGNFYVRAFVKQYADAVGLDGDELLNQYEDYLAMTKDEKTPMRRSTHSNNELPSRLERSQQLEKSNWDIILSYMPLILLVLIILVIVSILITALNKTNESEKAESTESVPESALVTTVDPESVSIEEISSEEKSQESVEESESSIKELKDNQVRVGNQVLTLVSDPSGETVYQLEGDFSDYEIEVRADSFVWVGVFEDGNIVVDETVNEGDSVKYTAKPGVSELRITLGYPEGGKFYVNGVEVPIESDYQKEVMVFISKDSQVSNPESTPQEEVPVEEEPVAGESTPQEETEITE